MESRKKIYRSNSDRLIFGVCGGIAKYFEVDAIIVRLIFLALFVGGGSGLIIYLICALVIPSEDKVQDREFINEGKVEEFVGQVSEKVKDLSSEVKKTDWKFIFGMILIILGFIFLVNNIFDLRLLRVFRIVFWPLVLILIGIIILFRKK